MLESTKDDVETLASLIGEQNAAINTGINALEQLNQIRKNKDKKFVECPGPENQRLGDYRNEFKLERVSGHERSKDGTKCITLYEEVPFIEQYIPNTSQLISTAAIATVAASTPLLLNVIKPLIKQIFKKLTNKKEKIE